MAASTETMTMSLSTASLVSLPELNLTQYDISTTTGFVPDPSDPPLRSLPEAYKAWDDLATSLPDLIKTRTIRDMVTGLQVLPTDELRTRRQLQRAFVALGFVVNAYVWCGSFDNGVGDTGEREDIVPPVAVVPPQLSEPYLEVCEKLSMRQSLVYAGLCLWNWTFKKNHDNKESVIRLDHQGGWDLDEMKCLVSFTGTRDEDVFYLVPVLAEVEGGRLITLLLEALRSTERADGVEQVENALRETYGTLHRMASLLKRLHQNCGVQVFYNQIRPSLQGGLGKEELGMDRGIVFEKRGGKGVSTKWAGGSAGQSSTFQMIDMVLGVLHRPIDEDNSMTFYEEARCYMPREHKDFLRELSKLGSLRAFVQDHPELMAAYNNCLNALSSWRSKHIGVVTTHIVTPSRKAKALIYAELSTDQGTNVPPSDESDLAGTGGSALIPFLKQAKQDTLEARL